MKMEKQKSIFSLLFFEQTLLSNRLRYRLEILKLIQKILMKGSLLRILITIFVVF